MFGKIYGEVSLDRIHITTEGDIDDAQDGFRPEMVGGISSLLWNRLVKNTREEAKGKGKLYEHRKGVRQGNMEALY